MKVRLAQQPHNVNVVIMAFRHPLHAIPPERLPPEDVVTCMRVLRFAEGPHTHVVKNVLIDQCEPILLLLGEQAGCVGGKVGGVRGYDEHYWRSERVVLPTGEPCFRPASPVLIPGCRLALPCCAGAIERTVGGARAPSAPSRQQRGLQLHCSQAKPCFLNLLWFHLVVRLLFGWSGH